METFRIVTLLLLTILGTAADIGHSELLRRNAEYFCEGGWYGFGDFCFKGFSEKLNFRDAEKKCREHHGQLVAILSPDVQEYVAVQVLSRLEYRAYIGLSYNESLLRMHWSNGSDVTFTAWDRGEPSGKAPKGEDEHCVEMTFVNVLDRIGKWNDISCEQNIPFICQKPQGFEGTKPKKDPERCPWSSDGTFYRNTCYHVISLKKSWQEAEEYCLQNYNGHLASVTDPAMQMYMHYILKKSETHKIWIGFRKTVRRRGKHLFLYALIIRKRPE